MTTAAQVRWTPSIGAWPETGGTAFRVWAPVSARVDVVVDRADGAGSHQLDKSSDGMFSATVPGVTAGDRYRYRLDGGGLLPDPASRYQPDGVHGPSAVVDARAFEWSDGAWKGVDRADLIFYELHVGTFTPEGTFAGAMDRLAHLADLGVTAIELMPVADFPGDRNWGYDGVALYAPARCYGTPDDLRRLVDAAHGRGLAVYLDVVYNHLGPDGAYLGAFSPYYFSARHQTPWGAGLNFDGEHSGAVREFFIQNALHWVHEYHMDGLRLDAAHAIADDSPRHFLAELTTRIRESPSSHPIGFVAEDHRNLNQMLKPEREGGWGIDLVWADAFHHQCRRLLAGDSEGYFRDFSGRTDDLATTMRRGWFYTGQFSSHLGRPRGTDPTGLDLNRFVICLQNHDQIGNRALGERLSDHIDQAQFRAASVLLLTAPETPLLFMGQEWSATTPFLYFTDHHHELGRLVTEGRRQEFRQFAAFSRPVERLQIPDPQAASTWSRSRLDWDEPRGEVHTCTLRLYRRLLALRRREPPLRPGGPFRVEALDDSTIALRRNGAGGAFLVVVRLRGAGVADLSAFTGDDGPGGLERWRLVLSTEDPAFSPDSAPPGISLEAGTVRFDRPAALVFERIKASSASAGGDGSGPS